MHQIHPMDKHKDIDRLHFTARDSTFSVTEQEVRLQLKKNRIIRFLYMLGGTVSIILAILGIILPGLPVTPFALLSAFLYAKSSPKLYHWLMNNKVLGPRIRDYQRNKGITRKGKIGIISFMSLMVLFSSFVVVGPGTLRWVIIAFGIIGCIVVTFIVPNAKDNNDK